MLDDLKLIHERDAHDALGAVERQYPELKAWVATVPTSKNLAKQIALEVIGKTPVIYSGKMFAPVAANWKHGFNQYAKHLAWTGEYPANLEAELSSWTRQPVYKPYTVIDLRSALDPAKTREAFEMAERLLSGKRPSPFAVEVAGKTKAQQIVWATVLGDYVTIYTAILNGVNPSTSPIGDSLKKL